MMNVVAIAGHLGSDPDIRYTPSGTAVANLSLAVNEFFKDGQGESQKRTHWFRATAFGRTAEIAGEYLHKGSKVGISGQLVSREWQDGQGNNRRSVEIRVRQLELLGNGNGNGHENGEQRQTGGQKRSDAYEAPPDDLPPPSDVTDGDIPF
jgi:single-strand DNA-binding protein